MMHRKKSMKKPATVLILGGILCAAGCRKPAPKSVDFGGEIKPLLESRCVNCHHAGALLGNLSLENRALAFKERPAGPVIVPGRPEQSRLYLVLTLPETDRKAMPPVGHRIPTEDVALIKRWIAEGAAWPEGPKGALKPTVTPKSPEA
jgi:mono/diheme cytochrome c family protein